MIARRLPRAGGSWAHGMLSVGFLGRRRMKCRSQDPKRDPASILADREPPIEVATYDDARLGIAGALSIGEELEGLRAERDGGVIGEGGLLGGAADVVGVGGRREGAAGGPR